MSQLVHRGLGTFDVHQHVVSFVNLVDRVSQVTTAPIFQAMYLAAIFSDDAGITLDHRGHLLALIRMYHKNDFVVTHEFSLRFKQLSSAAGAVKPRSRA